MLGAVLLAGAAALSAGFALQYAWVFCLGVRKRHSARCADVSLFGRSHTILALNDADVYASWRLARVNVIVAVVCLVTAAAIRIAVR